MFTMMNNARLSVGLEGLAVGERAYQQAVAYARSACRASPVGAAGRRAGADHRAPRRAPDAAHDARARSRRCAALVYLNAECDRPRRAAADDEAERDRAQRAGRPAHADHQGVGHRPRHRAHSLAVQVHGGMGYIEETGVAQHYRDIRIAAIYEGTNGIQAMDLVGRKLPMRGGGVMTDFLAGIDATAAEAHGVAATPALVEHRRAARRGRGDVPRRPTEWLLTNGLADPQQRPGRGDAVPAHGRHRHRRLAARPVGDRGRRAQAGDGPAEATASRRVPRPEARDRPVLRDPAPARRPPAWSRRSPPAPPTSTPPRSDPPLTRIDADRSRARALYGHEPDTTSPLTAFVGTSSLGRRAAATLGVLSLDAAGSDTGMRRRAGWCSPSRPDRTVRRRAGRAARRAADAAGHVGAREGCPRPGRHGVGPARSASSGVEIHRVAPDGTGTMLGIGPSLRLGTAGWHDGRLGRAGDRLGLRADRRVSSVGDWSASTSPTASAATSAPAAWRPSTA